VNPSCGAGSNINTAFRIGVDGTTAPIGAASPTLPQPDFPGVNDISAGAGEAWIRISGPNVVDAFTFTIQRQLSRKLTMELGYIGRRITTISANQHKRRAIHDDQGRQRFDKAYANVVMQYCGRAGTRRW